MTGKDVRKIIHIDMDAFFASVEQRDNPALRGKPVAVGGNKERGVVAAASYEARKYGVRSAMPSKIAYQKCPEIIFVKHRFDVYKEVSSQIRAIFHQYTDLVEPLSLDEAFLDVTENKKNIKSAIRIAQKIKEEIKATTQLTASAGCSINKFLAKIASDLNKPDGLTYILPEQAEPFLAELAIEKFFGVGKRTAEKMHKLGIYKGADLKKKSKLELAQQFGKFGTYLYDVVRGKDDRKVVPDRIRKSISSETTYDQDLITIQEVERAVKALCENLASSCQKREIMGKTINLKIRFDDFTTYTRSKTVTHYTNDADLLLKHCMAMITGFGETLKPVRLLGVGLSSLNEEKIDFQLKLDFNDLNDENASSKNK